MIKLFRTIRKKLLREGKVTNYLKYAIGEIVLVVIGILIALSINNWNENHKSEKEARFQLSKLRANLKQDKKQIENAIADDSTYIANLLKCVSILSDQRQATKSEFMDYFQFLMTTSSFNQTRGSFESLISSGKIELIDNQDLLDALFAYYNTITFRAWDSSIIEYSRNIFAPYIMHFDHVPNVTDEREGNRFTKFDISKFSIPGKTIDDYKNDQFILNALRTKIQLFEGQKIQYQELLVSIDTLIQMINQELEDEAEP